MQIHTTGQGAITQMHIGIMGTMAQMMLSETGEKVRCGQLGRARAGRIPGGLAYGYEVVPPAPGAKEAGERRIIPDEAAVVYRIVREYAAGNSPRQEALQPGPAPGGPEIPGSPDQRTLGEGFQNPLGRGRLSAPFP